MNKFCPLPFTHLSLEPSGNVYSCCNTIDFSPLGSIQKLSFEEKQNALMDIFFREDRVFYSGILLVSISFILYYIDSSN